jgi:uncharacterized protein YdeI (YjbR/CyaY-like superfamily)
MTNEYFHLYRRDVVRPGASLSRSGLELSCDPRNDRECDILNALSRAMVGVGTTGRERDPDLVLVLEHRRKHHHVFLFCFPARSGWDSGLFAKLAHLHPQFNADSKAAVGLHRRGGIAASSRKQLAMGKKDPRVDAYIRKAQPFARPILNHLRRIAHGACPDVKETIKWQMPFFDYKGPLCFMAAFQQHCAFGFWRGKLLFGHENKGAMRHFGRITSIDDLPKEKKLIGYVRKAAELNETGVTGSRTLRGKQKLNVPVDLRTALQKNARARKTFNDFSYSHKKEYVDWITGAKRDETRQRRLKTAIQWLGQGKPQNWKYL